MKNTLLIIFILLGLFDLNGQTIQSSCVTQDSVLEQYREDADRLALRKIYRQNLTYRDSIVIPAIHSDTVLNALIAVYNAISLPARDTVVSMFNLHSFNNPMTNYIEVDADSNSLWMQQLKIGNIPTGSIYIDKTDYLQLNPADIRRQIGYVPQDVVLFYGSIKDNIRLGAPYVSDEALLEVADLSGVNQFTQIHPEGFDKQVGERGCRLSAGQRQAVAIARALILSPNVLLFDEPTASMDDASEVKLRKKLKTQIEAKNNTFILITHKASMLELVDRIIILDSGRVVADGPKESVLKALQGGIKIK